MALVPTEWILPPDPKALYVARPALGAVASGFAQQENHLQGWRFQRAAQAVIEQPDTGLALAQPYGTVPVPASDTHWVVLETNAEADPVTGYVPLWVAFTYFADSDQVSAPQVVASVEDLAAAVQDAGCTWSVDNGWLEDQRALPGGRPSGGVAADGTDASQSVFLTAHTGYEPEDTVLVSAYPRPLNAPANTTVAVKLVVQGVAVFSISVSELFREEI